VSAAAVALALRLRTEARRSPSRVHCRTWRCSLEHSLCNIQSICRSIHFEVTSMQTVKFRAGETIISDGEDGNTAFLIVSGSVVVSVGQEAKAKTVGTLGPGAVFGEMCLIEPGPRSATVKAVTDAECVAMSYDEFIPSMENDPQRAIMLMRSLVQRLRETNNLLSIAPVEVLGQRIQQG